MPRVTLKYSPSKRQYSLSVGVALDSNPTQMVPAEMILDTGTNRSSITVPVAEALGLNINHLPMTPAGGITAIQERPYVENVTLWIASGDVVKIPLEYMLVLTDVERKEKRSKGGMKVRRAEKLEAPSLFGMDAIAAMNGKVRLDPANEKGWID